MSAKRLAGLDRRVEGSGLVGMRLARAIDSGAPVHDGVHSVNDQVRTVALNVVCAALRDRLSASGGKMCQLLLHLLPRIVRGFGEIGRKFARRFVGIMREHGEGNIAKRPAAAACAALSGKDFISAALFAGALCQLHSAARWRMSSSQMPNRRGIPNGMVYSRNSASRCQLPSIFLSLGGNRFS